MKTLVYFASGPKRERYYNLNYDKVILIDKIFDKPNSKTIYDLKRNKIVCIGMDCLQSIEYLKHNNIKIDCFVVLNEGLFEGGGSYPLHGDFFLGKIMPLFNKEYIHIFSPSYYRIRKIEKLDIPFSKKQLSEYDNQFIDPKVFSNHSGGKVYLMTKNTSRIEFSVGNTIVRIVNDSIWEDYDYLDLLFLSGKGNHFNGFNKVKSISSFSNMMQVAEDMKLACVGCTPFGGAYVDIIKNIAKATITYPKEISFYHLNTTDFSELKKYVNDKYL